MSASPNPAFQSYSFRRFLVRRVKFLIVALPLTCAVLLVPYEGWLLELMRQFRLWCAGLAVVLCFCSLLLKIHRWLPLALLTAVWQGWPWIDYRRAQDTGGGGERVFTLLTCNLFLEAVDPPRMIASLEAADPEVLVLLEYTPRWQSEMQRTLWARYPYRVEQPLEGAAGICLASRLPLEHARVVEDGADFPCIMAIVTAGEVRTGVLVVHPMPPLMPEGYAPWRTAMLSWPALLRKMEAPHQVVAGDFNATPFCRTFTQLCETAGLHESARGFGIPSTWFPGKVPAGLPLDHVLLSAKLRALSCETGPEAGSDHRWVKVALAVIP